MFSKVFRKACCLTMVFGFLGCYANGSAVPPITDDGSATGGSLKPVPGYQVVQRECTLCHSEKLITQNKASRNGWTETIRWMQKTQNLREFSAEEEKTILDYLAENYAPLALSRRLPLTIREWYVLEP